jgi:uncharacterized protein YndB with AHSA1/START domain
MSDDSYTSKPIVSSRLFAAPASELFRVFADANQLAQWWGPTGFVNTISEFDLRPGGAWHMVMQGPDGSRYPMEKRFVEIVPDARVVFDHIQAGHDFRMTLEFKVDAGGTRVMWTMKFADAAEADRLRSIIGEANEQNFDRLAAFLASHAAGNQA